MSEDMQGVVVKLSRDELAALKDVCSRDVEQEAASLVDRFCQRFHIAGNMREPGRMAQSVAAAAQLAATPAAKLARRLDEAKPVETDVKPAAAEVAAKPLAKDVAGKQVEGPNGGEEAVDAKLIAVKVVEFATLVGSMAAMPSRTRIARSRLWRLSLSGSAIVSYPGDGWHMCERPEEGGAMRAVIGTHPGR